MKGNSQSKLKICATAIFLCVQAILFYMILWSRGNTVACEYSAVCLCFIFALLHIKNDKPTILIIFGLLFTVIADLFLVVFGAKYRTFGMTAFSIVQLMYFARLLTGLKSQKFMWFNIITRIVCTSAALSATALILKHKTDLLSLVSVFYFTNIVLNTALAFIRFKTSPLFAFGLLLFLLCDTFIGLQIAAGTYINIPTDSWLYSIISPGFNIAWMFYVPSQTLIALSVARR